jgi:hypothetical protein
MDAKTAFSILRDEESYSTSQEDFEKGIWTHIDIYIDDAKKIADHIEQQAKYAELGRLALTTRATICSNNDFKNRKNTCEKHCTNYNYCKLRAQLLAEEGNE